MGLIVNQPLASPSFEGLLKTLGVEIQRGDVRNPSDVETACRGIDTIYHTAAIAGIWGSWDSYHSINTEGTRVADVFYVSEGRDGAKVSPSRTAEVKSRILGVLQGLQGDSEAPWVVRREPS